MIEERVEQVGVKDDELHGRGGLMGGAVVGEKSKNRGLLATVGGVLLLAVVAGGGFWLWDGDGTERKARNDFCRSLVPGGKPEDGVATAECGEALETAMTGRPPGATPPERTPRHGAKRVRVFEEVVRGYGERVRKEPEAVPREIRRNMANALNFYSADVREILGLSVSFSDERLSTKPNDVDLDRAVVVRFIRGLAEDGKSYRAIRDFQLRLGRGGVAELGKEDFEKGSEKADAEALVMGKIMGTLDGVGSEVLQDRAEDEAFWKSWLEAYGEDEGDGEGSFEELVTSHRGSGSLVEMFRERSKRLGVVVDSPESRGTGLHPKILERITETYRQWS